VQRQSIWCSFICILSLASVLQTNLQVNYPDFGPPRYRTLFSNLILPRHAYEKCEANSSSTRTFSEMRLLFCQAASHNKCIENFSANHFVPLVYKTKGNVSLKRSMLSSGKANLKKCKKTLHKSPFEGRNLYDFFPNMGPSANNQNLKTLSDNVEKINFISTSTTVSVSTSVPSVTSSSVLTSTYSSVITTSSSSKTTSCCTSVNTTTTKPTIIPPFFQKIKNVSSSSNNDNFASNPSVSDSQNDQVGKIERSLPEDKYDVGFYFSLSKSLSDNDIYDLLVNCDVPADNFKFPKNSTRRQFQKKWLEDFDWLFYSKKFDGGFCLPCALFGHLSTKLKTSENLLTKAVSGGKGSVALLKKHDGAKQGLHADCLKLKESFLLRFQGKLVPINTLVDSVKVEKRNKAKAILPAIIDTVILCGHLGLPLRGHRDDKQFHPEAGEYAKISGVGNFVELLNFGIRRGDTLLKEHYNNHAANASYFSKSSQNEFINICGALIIEQVVLSIRPSQNYQYFFSVIADEAMDSSQKEQLSLVLRFIDCSSNILEEFVGFIHLRDGLTGKAISDAILKKVSDLGLDIMNCRGQGYDGAGSVAGYKNGASAHILRINRKAIYTHCFSHRLSLAVTKGFNITSVNNMIETVQKISYFFQYSEQRQLCFERHVSKFCPKSTSKKLRDPSRTRWVERIKDLDLFIELFQPLWSTLDTMRVNESGTYNKKTQTDAFSFFKAIDCFSFIINLILTYRVLELSLLVTELLQSKTNDIADGIHMITSLCSRVANIRRNVDVYHEKWYNESVLIAKRLNICVTKPRTNKRQIFRDNHNADDISSFYRVSLTIPLLDCLERELNSRFSENSLVVYTGLHLIPSKILEKEGTIRKQPLKDLCKSFFSFYHDDFPYPLRIEAELGHWEEFWRTHKVLCPSNISDTLKAIPPHCFPNIRVALRILATVPITSCECERSFSGMKRVKHCLRSKMGPERMNGLCLMNFHLDKVPDANIVCDKYLSLKDRVIAGGRN